MPRFALLNVAKPTAAGNVKRTINTLDYEMGMCRRAGRLGTGGIGSGWAPEPLISALTSNEAEFQERERWIRDLESGWWCGDPNPETPQFHHALLRLEGLPEQGSYKGDHSVRCIPTRILQGAGYSVAGTSELGAAESQW
jgi:hypothetical protein